MSTKTIRTSKNIAQDLAKLANELDKLGMTDKADFLDSMLVSIARDPDHLPPYVDLDSMELQEVDQEPSLDELSLIESEESDFEEDAPAYGSQEHLEELEMQIQALKSMLSSGKGNKSMVEGMLSKVREQMDELTAIILLGDNEGGWGSGRIGDIRTDTDLIPESGLPKAEAKRK